MSVSESTPHPKFKISHLPRLFKETYKKWSADDPWRLSAVVAYYAVFSLPGLMVVVINTVGFIWGYEIVEGELTEGISRALSPEAAKSIQEIIASTQGGNKSLISTIIGIASIIFGATGVFYHLQLSLNNVWGIKQEAHAGIKKLILDRLMGFGFVLVFGFLLLISFVLSAAISLLNDYLQQFVPAVSIYTGAVFGELLSLGIISVLFALLFKFLPDVRIKWKPVLVGALITGILFSIGKVLMGIYFGKADPSSAYGAAGSIILVLLWVSYSCLILFFGAEFSWVYAKNYGYKIAPGEHAVTIQEAIQEHESFLIHPEKTKEKT